MSADLDLDDLAGAREDVTAAVMAILDVAVVNPSTRDELLPVMFRLGDVHSTLNRAIEAMGKAADAEVKS
jgi:hypothetical protein